MTPTDARLAVLLALAAPFMHERCACACSSARGPNPCLRPRRHRQPASLCAAWQPQERFKGQPGEQWTMFLKDPSNNALEFKAMANPDFLFARYSVDGH